MKTIVKSLATCLLVAGIQSELLDNPEFSITVFNEAEGAGKTPQKGDRVRVHYTGTLMDGTKFDSSRDRNAPFDFNMGMGRVIKCWDEAFAQLQKGHKAEIMCPADLAYGSKGAGKIIPPDAALKFDVELLEINPPATKEQAPKQLNKEQEKRKNRRARIADQPPIGDVRTHFCLNQYSVYLSILAMFMSFLYLIYAIMYKAVSVHKIAASTKRTLKKKASSGKAA